MANQNISNISLKLNPIITVNQLISNISDINLKITKNVLGIILFEIFVFIQIGTIIITVYLENYPLIYLVSFLAILWTYFMFKRWNVDERTDTAINEASRSTVKLFLIIIFPMGLIFIIFSQFNQSILWEVDKFSVVNQSLY